MGGPLTSKTITAVNTLITYPIAIILLISVLFRWSHIQNIPMVYFVNTAAWLFLSFPAISKTFIRSSPGLIFILSAIILLFLLFFNKMFPYYWLIFLTCLFTCLLIGGMIVEFLKLNFIKSYSENPQINISREWLIDFSNFFDVQQMVYLALPIGCFVSSLSNIYFETDTKQFIIDIIRNTVLLSSFLLFLVLILTISVLCKSYIRTKGNTKVVDIPYLKIDENSFREDDENFENFGGWSGLSIKEQIKIVPLFFKSLFRNKTGNYKIIDLQAISDKLRIDIGIGLTEIRKIFFYYSLFNGVVFSMLLFLLFNFFQLDISNKFLIGILTLPPFLFSQLPYTIGQFKTHEILKMGKEGKEKLDLEEQLAKYLPLFPKFTLVVSLTSGFAGSFIISLFAKDLKVFFNL